MNETLYYISLIITAIVIIYGSYVSYTLIQDLRKDKITCKEDLLANAVLILEKEFHDDKLYLVHLDVRKQNIKFLKKDKKKTSSEEALNNRFIKGEFGKKFSYAQL